MRRGHDALCHSETVLKGTAEPSSSAGAASGQGQPVCRVPVVIVIPDWIILCRTNCTNPLTAASDTSPHLHTSLTELLFKAFPANVV